MHHILTCRISGVQRGTFLVDLKLKSGAILLGELRVLRLLVLKKVVKVHEYRFGGGSWGLI